MDFVLKSILQGLLPRIKVMYTFFASSRGRRDDILLPEEGGTVFDNPGCNASKFTNKSVNGPLIGTLILQCSGTRERPQ